jgi:hypothetical protein
MLRCGVIYGSRTNYHNGAACCIDIVNMNVYSVSATNVVGDCNSWGSTSIPLGELATCLRTLLSVY